MLARLRSGDAAGAARLATEFVAQHPDLPIGWIVLGSAAAHAGDDARAIPAYGRALELSPDDHGTLNNLGNVLQRAGRLDEAVHCYERAIALRGDIADIHANLARLELVRGRPHAAVAAWRRVLALRDDPPSLAGLGHALAATGALDEAIAVYVRVLKARPDMAEVFHRLGLALALCDRLDEAAACLERAAHLLPRDADVLDALADVRRRLGHEADAIALVGRALAIDPARAETWCTLGNLLARAERRDEARAAYDRALALQPGYAHAHANLGNLHRATGDAAAAAECYRRALAIDASLADVHASLGQLHADAGGLDMAVACLEAALAHDPAHGGAAAMLLHVRQQMCDWNDAANWAQTASRLAEAGVPPFSLLAAIDDPALQRRASERWAAASPDLPVRQPAIPAAPAARLRIGYFSADFHDHATVHLMGPLLEAHDRSRFEVLAFSYGPDIEDAGRSRVRGAVDRFIACGSLGDRALAERARAERLDIAIDCKGYTAGARLAPFAARIAPVQISYLGYPGTLASGGFDYIVADRTVVPPVHRAHYAEALIQLPHCYQPNRLDPVDAPATRRADHGLPDDGLVLCSFNNSFKIGPREFAIWMDVLAHTPHSVLWLLGPNRWAIDNLRAAAARHGVAPDRLVFAPRVSRAAHLERHTHADLFCDSFAYNAHTTASDALAMGVPLVTRIGAQFAARVSASLLGAVGLDALVCTDDAAYAALIATLAADRDRLADVRARLLAARAGSALFDCAAYARAFEAGLLAAHRAACAGRVPEDIAIAGD